jgi:hypothetical protein
MDARNLRTLTRPLRADLSQMGDGILARRCDAV